MNDKPINNDDPIIKELERKIEALKQQEALEKLAHSNMAKPEGQPLAAQSGESSDQAELKKMVAGKSYDALAQAHSRLGSAAPAFTEAGMNRRVESGAEIKDKEYWAGKYGVEGRF